MSEQTYLYVEPRVLSHFQLDHLKDSIIHNVLPMFNMWNHI